MEKHLGHLLRDEWNRPSEYVQKVGKQIGMLGIHELLDVQITIRELDYGSLIVVYVTVVRCTEYSQNRRELFELFVPLVGPKSFQLCLMSSDNADEVVLFQYGLQGLLTEIPTTSSDFISLVHELREDVLVLHWVGPQEITK